MLKFYFTHNALLTHWAHMVLMMLVIVTIDLQIKLGNFDEWKPFMTCLLLRHWTVKPSLATMGVWKVLGHFTLLLHISIRYACMEFLPIVRYNRKCQWLRHHRLSSPTWALLPVCVFPFSLPLSTSTLRSISLCLFLLLVLHVQLQETVGTS